MCVRDRLLCSTLYKEIIFEIAKMVVRHQAFLLLPIVHEYGHMRVNEKRAWRFTFVCFAQLVNT